MRNSYVESAEEEYRRAGEALLRSVMVSYPVGSLLAVKTNTAAGERTHEIEVTGHGCWWSNPTELRGVNIATGKRRKFYASDVQEILTEASAPGGNQ